MRSDAEEIADVLRERYYELREIALKSRRAQDWYAAWAAQHTAEQAAARTKEKIKPA